MRTVTLGRDKGNWGDEPVAFLAFGELLVEIPQSYVRHLQELLVTDDGHFFADSLILAECLHDIEWAMTYAPEPEQPETDP